MIGAVVDLLLHFRSDVKRGWRADSQALMTGKVLALAVSGPVIVVLATFTRSGVIGAVMVGVAVQLVLGWAIAGREMRLNR